MVRQVMKLCIGALLIVPVLIFCVSAESYTPYSGTLSSTHVNIFRDVAEGLKPSDKYVVWRDSEDEYCMYYSSSLTESSGTYTGEEGKLLTLSSLRVGSGTSYYTYYELSDRDISSFELSNPYAILVYSSFPGTPILHEGGQTTNAAILIILLVGAFFILITRLFRSGRRI